MLSARTLERIQILRAMVSYGDRDGLHAAVICDHANAECDHDLLEALPPISRRAIGAKLSAMAQDGLVQSRYDHDERLGLWWTTRKGQQLAASIGEERSHGC